MTWRNHTEKGERFTVLDEFDDGSAICLSSTSGGTSPFGFYGHITLMHIKADGTTLFRDYEAMGDWNKGPISGGKSDE